MRNVPHILQAVSAYADMILRALYSNKAIVENYKFVWRNKQKRASKGLGALGCGSPETG